MVKTDGSQLVSGLGNVQGEVISARVILELFLGHCVRVNIILKEYTFAVNEYW